MCLPVFIVSIELITIQTVYHLKYKQILGVWSTWKSQSAIALNNAIMDRYDTTTPCFDLYIGPTCDYAFEAVVQMLKENESNHRKKN